MANVDYTLTAARKAIELNPEKHNGFTHKFTVPYSDIVAAGATGTTDTVTIKLGATPAKWMVTGSGVNVTTAFAGVTSQAGTVSVGTYGGDVGFAVPATSVFAAGLKSAATGPNNVTNIANAQAQTSAVLTAVYTNATAGTPSSLTAGSMDIYVKMLDLTQLG